MILEKRNSIYLWIILILYFVLLFIVGYHHEPWADEAQSWLIARDCSWKYIFSNISRYEGHPFVFFYILKCFINLSPDNAEYLYRYIFLIPLFFSSVGMYLFIFKSKFPLWIKCIIPFTFFLFFQSGVCARDYSLCFFILSLIALYYPVRLKHPVLYTLLLIFAANIHLFLWCFVLILFIFFLFDIIKAEPNNKIRAYILPLVISTILLLITILYMYPPSDCTSFVFWEDETKYIRQLKRIINIFIPSNDNNYVLLFEITILALIYYIPYNIYCKNLYQKLLFISLNLPIYFIYLYFYIQPYHGVFAFSILIFTCWILANENNISKLPRINMKNAIFYLFYIIILFYQVYYNILISKEDIYTNYCGSKEAVEFIKKYNLDRYEINGIGFKSVALQPYFNKNIYTNYYNSAYYSWTPLFERYFNVEDYYKMPILVVSVHEMSIPDKILETHNYYYFNGDILYLNYKNNIKEINGFRIYVNKDIAEHNHLPSIAK